VLDGTGPEQDVELSMQILGFTVVLYKETGLSSSRTSGASSYL
jgi:hypothetical protein